MRCRFHASVSGNGGGLYGCDVHTWKFSQAIGAVLYQTEIGQGCAVAENEVHPGRLSHQTGNNNVFIKGIGSYNVVAIIACLSK